MSIEDFSGDIDSWETWQSAEAPKEVSEKFKEQIKKSSSWLKRTKKDEKKAKRQDLLLANFLVKMIMNKKYDFLLEHLFSSLNSWVPSNIILWILSLIFIEISNKIRDLSWLKHIEFSYFSETSIDFDDDNLDSKIKDRINFWVEDIVLSVSVEYSSLQTSKIIHSISSNKDLLIFTSKVFKTFLKEININISDVKSLSISEFILFEIETNIKRLKIEEI